MTIAGPAVVRTSTSPEPGLAQADAPCADPWRDALPSPEDEVSPAEIGQRFAWARRQGRPAWLWPEVRPEAWREALGGIEVAVRGVLSGRPDAERLDGDPSAIGLAGYTSGVGPLLGWWIERGVLSVSPAVAPVLAHHLLHNRLRAARMEAGAVAVVQALSGQGVPVAVLKGAHTGRAYFPDPGVRPASDVDLLVRPRDAVRAEAVLAAQGFVLQNRAARESSWRPEATSPGPRSLTFVHADDPWSVDLHSSLDLFVSAGAPLAALDRLQPMASRSPWPLSDRAVVLDQPALLLHLAVHAGSGLQNLTLLRLVELCLVIRQGQVDGALSWDDFLEAGAHAGVLGFAYPALRLAEDLTPELVPALVLERCAAAAPFAVRKLVSGLTPATAQRIDRTSVAEHFMWTSGWSGRARQLFADVAPAAGSWAGLWSIYEKRAWRLIRGRFSP